MSTARLGLVGDLKGKAGLGANSANYWDGNGVLQELPAGTDGQAYTTHGVGSAPTFATVSGGSGGGTGGVFAGARVYNSGNQTLTTGVVTSVTFDSERFDTDGFHSTSSNTSRMTIPAGKGGYYLIGGNVLWAANSTGGRLLLLKVNGTTTIAAQYLNPLTDGGDQLIDITTLYNLNAGDYVELQAYQGSGGNLAIKAGANYANEFWLTKLEPNAVPSTIGAKANRTTNQTVTDSTWTAVAFDAESYDTDGIHSTSSNTERFTVATAGTYVLTGWFQYTANVAAYCAIAIRKNGSTFINGYDINAGTRGFTLTLVDKAIAGDYYELMAFQSSGSSKTLDSSGAFPPTFVAVMVAGTAPSALGETLISEQVLTGTAASVSFSSIPATYRDLRVVVRGRSDAAVTSQNLNVQFNGDTGANYDYDYYFHAGASGFSGNDAFGQTSLFVGHISGASATANTPAACVLDVFDYRGTTFHKVTEGRTATKQANSANSMPQHFTSGVWRSTSAINQVTVSPASGNFIAGTIVSLYGRM